MNDKLSSLSAHLYQIDNYSTLDNLLQYENHAVSEKFLLSKLQIKLG